MSQEILQCCVSAWFGGRQIEIVFRKINAVKYERVVRMRISLQTLRKALA